MESAQSHPFLTGSTTFVRLAGQLAPYHVFISYRVASDSHHAEYLYDKLTAAGITVWWDKKCLLPGKPRP
jgi:hypothetical protein